MITLPDDGQLPLVGGALDGVSGWAMQGKQLDHLLQLTVDSLNHVLEKYSDHVVLDVRTGAEWQEADKDGLKTARNLGRRVSELALRLQAGSA